MNKLIDKIYQKIITKIKRRLTNPEHIYIISSIKKIDLTPYQNDLDDVAIILANTLIKNIATSTPELDMHEFLKKELDSTEQIYINKITTQTNSETVYDANITSLFNLLTTQDLVNVLNPSSLYKREYLVLDTRYAYTPNDKRIWKWDYVSTKNVRNFTVNSLGEIRNLVGLKLYALSIPRSPDVEAAPGFISMLIDEFSAQSFQTHTDRRYHFLLSKVPHLYFTEYVELTTIDNDTFRFDPPIAEFTTLTVSFGNPNTICSSSHPTLVEGRFVIPIEFTYIKNTV